MCRGFTYLKERIVLTAKNESIFEINECMMNALPSLDVEYFNSDTICKASFDI